VSDWPDEDEGDLGPEAAGPAAEVTTLLRRAAALRAELGEPAPPLDVELADDPGLASYQAIALAPLGPTDQQALLATPSAGARVARLRDLLAEEVEVLAARLAAG
jgi:hypothetical protein